MKNKIILIGSAMVTGWLVLSSWNNNAIHAARLHDPIEMSGTDVNKTKSTEDLLAAFKGESTASAKYAAYSKKAKQEGYRSIAMLFKAASAAEKIHADNHKTALEMSGTKVPVVKPEFTVKSTKENLEDAIKGESYEVSTMYPDFLKDADADGNQLAMTSLNYAFETEKKHKVMYENALAALGNNTVNSLPVTYYVCTTCGNTYDNTPAIRCGLCMTASEKFIKINSL